MDEMQRQIAQIVQGYPEEAARMTLEKFVLWLRANPLHLRDMIGTLAAGQLPSGTLYTTTVPTQGQVPYYNATTGKLEWTTITTADQILTDDNYETLVDDGGDVITGD